MRAAALKGYLDNARKVIHARLLSASSQDGVESLDIEVDVDLPQRPLYPIKAKERIRVRFPAHDGAPEVFTLRKGFPVTPHMLFNDGPDVRQLCLYESPWSEERSNWAPRPFLERIRRWFSGTADGTLHPGDQPLEPLIQPTSARVILPEIPFVEGAGCRVERLYLVQRNPSLLAAHRTVPAGAVNAIAVPVLVVQGPTIHHGIMHRVPRTLGDLEALLAKWGGSLVQSVAKEVEKVRNELRACAALPLLFVLELPKTREPGGKRETVEYQAFLADKPIGELFGTHVEEVKEGLLYVPKKRENFTDPSRLAKVAIAPLSVQWHLTAKSAAAMNGHVPAPCKVVAIGAGALGSPLAANLWRGGFGEWTIVDGDELESHNPARHLLNSDAVGLKKAEAVAVTLGAVFPDRPAPQWIACNYLAPGAEGKKLEAALGATELVLDLSASVTVGRALAGDLRTSARRVSAFLNPRGDESVLLAEDAKRTIDLFWLEAEYHRAVVLDPRLQGHFDADKPPGRRYGTGCREVSAVIAQDHVALHAALLSKAVRQVAARAEASVRIFRADAQTGAVTAVEVAVAEPFTVMLDGWRISIHPDVLREVSGERRRKLPAETGGILFGVIERTHCAIAILGMMPAPPDSEAWPTCFMRGSNGLAAGVSRITRRSAGNVNYVGEWHSHPDGCRALPSKLDEQAIALCSDDTRADGVPTLMLIVADGEIGLGFQAIDRDTPDFLLIR